jgi:hypothetical protein
VLFLSGLFLGAVVSFIAKTHFTKEKGTDERTITTLDTTGVRYIDEGSYESEELAAAYEETKKEPYIISSKCLTCFMANECEHEYSECHLK